MSDEQAEQLDLVYEELKGLRDAIELKLHLGGMELRDRWSELEKDWETWTHQLKQDLEATGEELEQRLRDAGGDDLRKLEIRTRTAISKLKRGFKDLASSLSDD